MTGQADSNSTFERVLVATDGRAESARVAELGLRLARVHDAAVHALYVVERRSSLGHLDPVVERREERGERAVEAVEARASEYGVPVVKAFRYGVPHEAIRRYAADHGIDIIVVGPVDASGLERLVTPKSVTERLVDGSPSPVVVAGTNAGGEVP